MEPVDHVEDDHHVRKTLGHPAATASGPPRPDACRDGADRRRSRPQLGLAHCRGCGAANSEPRPLRRHVRAGALHDGRLEILREQEQSGRRAGPDEEIAKHLKEKMMNTTRKLGFAATALAVILTTAALAQARKSVGEGKSVSVRVDLGGGRIIYKQKDKRKR